MPAQFVEAAEQLNRIEKLTHYVIDQAVMAAAAINREGHDFKVAVNISARLAQNASLVDVALASLQRNDLPASKLILEITETGTLDRNELALETLAKFQAAGIDVSIDDYGTGNATLNYLTAIPAREVKIDKSFVSDIDRDKDHRIIVESTIGLAHQLGRRVVAEGVETQAVLRILRKLSCDAVQGYLIGKPMEFTEIYALMQDRRTRFSVKPKAACG